MTWKEQCTRVWAASSPCVLRGLEAGHPEHAPQPLSPPCLAGAEAAVWDNTDYSSASLLALLEALHLPLALQYRCNARHTIAKGANTAKPAGEKQIQVPNKWQSMTGHMEWQLSDHTKHTEMPICTALITSITNSIWKARQAVQWQILRTQLSRFVCYHWPLHRHHHRP